MCSGGKVVLLDKEGNIWESSLQSNLDEKGKISVLYKQIMDVCNIVKVSVGHSHTIILNDSGLVWTSGRNFSKQLGRTIHSNHLFQYNPFGLVKGIPLITSIACGGIHSLFVKC